jgi:cytochrome c2
MKLGALSVAGLVLGTGVAAAAEVTDAGRGRALYENHCQVCHTPKVHTRVNRQAVSREELRQIVDGWQQQEGLRWSGQDVQDVVEFLNLTRYRMP